MSKRNKINLKPKGTIVSDDVQTGQATDQVVEDTAKQPVDNGSDNSADTGKDEEESDESIDSEDTSGDEPPPDESSNQTPPETPAEVAIEPTIKLADTPATPEVKPYDSTEVPKVVNEMTDLLNAANLTTPVKMALQTIQRYEEEMKQGRPINQKNGSILQRQLFLAIRTIINDTPYAQFATVFRGVLKTIETDKNKVFHSIAVFRFLTEGNFSETEGNMFRQALSMMITLAPPASRGVIGKQLDIRKALKGYNPAAIERVVEYFS